jgi:hypothetical protein
MARVEPPLLLAWSMVTAALVFGDIGSPVRTALAFGWLMLVPGLTLTRLIEVRELPIRLVIAVPLSLALDAAVSGVLVYAGLPSWEVGMSILISISVAAVILDLAPPRPGLRLVWNPAGDLRGKLAEESRQARMVEALLAGGTLGDAAEAAGVSIATLRRRLGTSEALRRAAEVAAGGPVDDLAGRSEPEPASQPPKRRVPQRRQ